MSVHKYEPLQDDGGEIRLLFVHPASNPQDEIFCDLQIVKLSTPPEYAALSYSWGPPIFDKRVTVNGDEFQITSSLDYALRYFRAQEWHILWADAICIDQTNVQERGQQVQIMWQIYVQAKFVVACLGVGKSNSKLAMKLIKTCVKASLAPSPFYHSTFDEWDAFHELLLSSYISRTWIVQEIVACRDTRLVYAGDGVPLEGLFMAINLSNRTASAEPRIRSSMIYLKNVPTMQKAIHSLGAIDQLRTSTNPNSTLLSLMRRFRNQLATDPRDKIYGLLGLAIDRDIYPRPDYAKSYERLYKEVAHAIASQTKPCIGGLLAEAGQQQQQQSLGLPSWVPDWSRTRERLSFCDKYWMDEERFVFMSDNDTPKGLNEGVRNPSIAKGTVTSELGSNHATLTLRGVGKDVIVALGPVLEWTGDEGQRAGFLNWDTASRSLLVANSDILLPSTPSDEASNNDEEKEKTLIPRYVNAIIANIFDREVEHGKPAGLTGRALEAYNALVVDLQAAILGRNNMETTETSEMRAKYMSCLTWATFGRRFCITGDGLLGLAPSSSMVGDVISILDGVRCPVVLRLEEDDGFVMIGDAYVECLSSELDLENRVDDIEDIQDITLH